ncbi:unnamed protein product [Linum trigynum]|uniref:Heptahelical transmembrane protein 1-like n=1 Tax=Linum trigynum TaxID=586398 RepID=A0AAV2CSG2_9ROSI
MSALKKIIRRAKRKRRQHHQHQEQGMAMDHQEGISTTKGDDVHKVVEGEEEISVVNHGIKKKINKEVSYKLSSFWELPEYMKDNEFILGYYRANWPLKEALFSICRWHNETLNVWTHLIGFLLFLGLTMANLVKVPQVADLFGLFTSSVLTSTERNASHDSNYQLLGTIDLKQISQQSIHRHLAAAADGTPAARWPFYVFLAGSMFCLLSSTICHLFSCHSHHLNLTLLRIDYVGIAVMIITSFFPNIYYVFQCEPHWQFAYLGGITVMGIFTIATLLTPSHSAGKFRGLRAMLFTSMGLFGLVPSVHAGLVNWSNPKRDAILYYEGAMALSYLMGTAFYVARVPERFRPGWFDLAGHSHQIFHVLVVLGALAHYGAALVFLEYRDQVGC